MLPGFTWAFPEEPTLTGACPVGPNLHDNGFKDGLLPMVELHAAVVRECLCAGTDDLRSYGIWSDRANRQAAVKRCVGGKRHGSNSDPPTGTWRRYTRLRSRWSCFVILR
jgi:hypothetical protein